MRSYSRKAFMSKQKNEVDKYIKDNYEKLIYESVAMNSGYVAKQAAAEFLWALSMHGYGAKRLNQFFEFFLQVCNMPNKIMGQTANADDIIDHVSNKFGIDFNRINTSYQSYEDFCKERDSDAA